MKQQACDLYAYISSSFSPGLTELDKEVNMIYYLKFLIGREIIKKLGLG